MVLKEKLLLSNCDSVHKRSYDQIRSRFLFGLVYSDGVILSPNMLIDNRNIDQLLSTKNIEKYLQEEGSGKLEVRGYGLGGFDDYFLQNYFENLPDNFILSSFDEKPTKSKLKTVQLRQLENKLSELDKFLSKSSVKIKSVDIKPNSLTREIQTRIQRDERVFIERFFASVDSSPSVEVTDNNEYKKFIDGFDGLISRSDWYEYSEKSFSSNFNDLRSKYFISEVVDPAYNYLFCETGEALVLDDIKAIDNLPSRFFDTSISLASYRNEYETVKAGVDYFSQAVELISAFPIKTLSETVLDFFEEKAQEVLEEQGWELFSRKNWFGFYPKMREKMGIEIK